MMNTEICTDITGLFLLSTDIYTGNVSEEVMAGGLTGFLSYEDLAEQVKSDLKLRWQSLDPAPERLKNQQQIVNRAEEISVDVVSSDHYTRLIKRWGDVIFSLLGVLFLLPFFFVIGIIIRISTKGPAFFMQERIGIGGRKFIMYKFRTMVMDAEFRLDDLKAYNEVSGPVFKIKHDPRITKVGRFLRQTGIDELPQLFNVVLGDMSLIGPRPPLEREVKQYETWQLRRLSVMPGITCTWQVTPNRHDVRFEEWVAMDLSYIDNWSLGKDIKLFFRTVKTFFLAGGH